MSVGRFQFGRGKPLVNDFRPTSCIALGAGRQCFCSLAGQFGLTNETFLQALDFVEFVFHVALPITLRARARPVSQSLAIAADPVVVSAMQAVADIEAGRGQARGNRILRTIFA